jgi:hypothetical protein
MAITKVQSVQGQATKSDQHSVKTKNIGFLPMGKSQQKQSAKQKKG